MRLTIRTNLAMRTLMACAVNEGKIIRRHEIALCCNASENHLAQVVNTLGQLGYLDNQRGRSGGIRLAKPASEITVGEVCRAFEAGTPFAECFASEGNSCPLIDSCLLKPALAAAVESFYAALDRVLLSDLVENNKGLDQLLNVTGPSHSLVCSL